jgi:tetratricopeptide (TPR) repeat protein
VLGWADSLKREDHFDDAIILLEETLHFETGDGRWKGKLAGILNLRGVQFANEENWKNSVDDLRRACQLNPNVPLFRQNLERALQGYASAAYKAGEYGLAIDLRDEAIAVSEGHIAEPEVSPAVAEHPAEEMQPSALPEFRLKENERANPYLFDELGLLKLNLFDPGGQKALALALEETAGREEVLLKLPALLSALTRLEDGETCRLVARQGISPRQVQAQISSEAESALDSEALSTVLVISQYKVGYTILRILDLAWEIAQYDQGKIGESHILYGLLVSGSATTILQAAGIDADVMIEQAAWYK